MPENKKLTLGIWIFTIGVIILSLYYYYPVYSGTYPFIHYLFSFNLISLLFWIDLVLTIFLLFSAIYGFYYRKKWSWWYVNFFLLYSSFWAIYNMFIMNWQVIEHFIYFVFYIVFLMYFNLSFVKEYFTEEKIKKKEPFFTYKGYILHKKEIETKTGKSRVFYFFSKTVKTSGVPCKKPEGYKVHINKRTGLPYLKKQG